jgi:hypothetical protein
MNMSRKKIVVGKSIKLVTHVLDPKLAAGKCREKGHLWSFINGHVPRPGYKLSADFQCRRCGYIEAKHLERQRKVPIITLANCAG